jgi:hypothetical protein
MSKMMDLIFLIFFLNVKYIFGGKVHILKKKLSQKFKKSFLFENVKKDRKVQICKNKI